MRANIGQLPWKSATAISLVLPPCQISRSQKDDAVGDGNRCNGKKGVHPADRGGDGGPATSIALLKKDLTPMPYGDVDTALVDGVRIFFSDYPEPFGNDAVPVELGCVDCGRILEACVWEAQDGRCEQCWALVV